jgi:release factor glutamine methyltransferase
MRDAAARAGSRAKVTGGTTIAAARRALSEAFRAAGLDTPELDARVLVGHAVGLDHAALVVAAGQPLTPGGAASVRALARRRLAREPVARIVGCKEFWGLPVRLGPETLVPRPETETIVEAALAAVAQDGEATRPLRLADLGTGSGALMLALLSELPNAFAIGTDVSLAALAVAAANAERLGLAARARFVACNFGAALAGGFDLVVANPPYIATADLAALDPEVRDHDPLRALDGGADGLACYRMLAADAARLIGSRGHLVVELGADMAQAAAAVFSRSGLVVAPPHRDLAGAPRALHITCG